MDISGQTKTQLNYQYVWQVNYDSVTSDSVKRLSENIGNDFKNDGNNSLTDVFGSAEYNAGYFENNILAFVGNNKSILDNSKWVDSSQGSNSTTKLLTTIHPIVKKLEDLVETNTDRVKTVNPGDSNSIVIPINIYFKMNALDNNQNGINYSYINLNNTKTSVKHIKKIKFMLENEAENKPFTFSIKFNINRNKVINIKPNFNTLPYIQRTVNVNYNDTDFFS